MKKFFLFLSAVLVSLAMQATVVTSDIALSDFNDDNTATYEDGTITATEGWQYVQKLSGFDVYGLSDSQVNSVDLVVELSAVPTAEVFVQISYSDETANDFSITVEQTQGRVALASKNVTGIAIKLKATGSATLSNVYFYKVVGKETETHLLNSDYELVNWAWDNRLLLENTWFNAIHEGDKIVVTYTSEANADPDYVGAQVRIEETNAEFTDVVESEIIQESQTNATFEIVLREADIEPLKTKGMYINGKKIVINKVDLYTYAQQIMVETELNSGAEVIDWNQHWVHTSGLPTLAAGDELRITVSAVESGQYWQVHFRHDDGGEDAITFGSSDETTPKVYSFALSAEQASNINATGKLLIAGANVTLSRFAIAQPMSIYDDRILCSEKHSLDNNWSGGFSIEKEKLSGLKEGNIICLQLTAVSRANEDDQVLLKYGDGWSDFSPSINYLFQANNAVASEEIPMTVEIPVTAKMRDQLRNQKLNIAGKNYTVTYVILKEGTPVNTVAAYLPVTSAGMATFIVPFNVPYLPDGVEAYELTNNGDEVIWANPVDVLEADKPVLIVAAEGEYEFVSEENASDDISGKTGTYANGALIGTYTEINPLAQKTDDNFNYVLNNQGGNVAFYQVRDNSCSVPGYRAYLSCAHDASDNSANFAPKMRLVFNNENTTTGMESVQTSEISSQKILRNGQILIIRDNKMFNVLGQQL